MADSFIGGRIKGKRSWETEGVETEALSQEGRNWTRKEAKSELVIVI